MNKSQRQLRVIPELSTEGIPFPWDITLSLLEQSCPLQPLIPIVPLKPAIELRMSNVEADWKIALHWVVRKKWNPCLKIPVPEDKAELYEPWGELMFRALELCIQCHKASHPASQYYRNPSDWYLQLIIEARAHDLCAVIANQSPGKKRFITDRYWIIKELKALRNPANPKTSPHFYRLMEASLELEKQDEFNSNYWRPYLSACSKWIQSLEKKTCQETFVQKNKIVRRTGRGRGTLTMLSFPE
jgi:hypothetical protein